MTYPTAASTTRNAPNSVAILSAACAVGKLHWTWPLVFCFIRFPLLVLGFVLADTLLRASGSANAAELAQAFTRYDMPLVADICCLALLIWQLRREGLTLKDIIKPTVQKIWRDVGIGILILVPLATISAAILGLSIFLSHSALDIINGSIINPLGLPWQVLICTLIIPLSSGVTEELIYRGYALPRLAALTGKRWQAVVVMALGFGLQHVAFMLVDWQLAIIIGIAMTVVGVGFGVYYFVIQQRLVPLMIFHWQSDFLALGVAPLMLFFLLK